MFGEGGVKQNLRLVVGVSKWGSMVFKKRINILGSQSLKSSIMLDDLGTLVNLNKSEKINIPESLKS